MSFLCPRILAPPSSSFSTRPLHQLLRPTLRCLHHPSPSLPTTARRRTYKTIQEARSRARSGGPFSVRAALLFVFAGCGMYAYFRFEKARMERKRIAEASKGMGRPKVGGEFELVDQWGGKFGSERLRGGFSLVYFGFTHCPDICPEELDKMARMIDLVSPPASSSLNPSTLPTTSPSLSLPLTSQPPSSQPPSPQTAPRPPLLPIFITCDPARDTPSVLHSYLSEFHPSIIGLTGTWEQIKDVCRKYRVYFSTPEGATPGMDYLVDHSIYFYLMDPEGDFVEAIGRQHSAEAAARIIKEHMRDWKGGAKK